MDERLQQAIAAIRANDNQTAQQLLAQFLKSNPNHPQGWFLLSQVVADRKQQIAFLNKTLTLDPDNKLARQKLTQLGETVPESSGLKVAETILPVSEGYRDFEEQADADTIPGWMAGHATHEVDAPGEVQAEMIMSEEPSEDIPMPQPEDIPAWLQEEPQGEWAPQPQVTEAAVSEKAAAASKPAVTPQENKLAETKKKAAAPKKVTDKGAEPLPWYFWAWAIVAVIIFIVLIFQVVGWFS